MALQVLVTAARATAKVAARTAAKAAARAAARAAAKKTEEAKKHGWFQKIPTEILLSPGGVALVLFALIMELVDLVPIPILDQTWEIPKEIFFMILLSIIAKMSFKSMIIPFIIERVPAINDIIPTWFIKMFF
jgi:hypothetical protein